MLPANQNDGSTLNLWKVADWKLVEIATPDAETLEELNANIQSRNKFFVTKTHDYKNKTPILETSQLKKDWMIVPNGLR